MCMLRPSCPHKAGEYQQPVERGEKKQPVERGEKKEPKKRQERLDLKVSAKNVKNWKEHFRKGHIPGLGLFVINIVLSKEGAKAHPSLIV